MKFDSTTYALIHQIGILLTICCGAVSVFAAGNGMPFLMIAGFIAFCFIGVITMRSIINNS
jgi:hypothetical protein